MNKKIFAVLGILAIVMIGCVYATDSADSSNNNTVTISGLNFTIPEGFTEDVDEAVVNESGLDEGYTYVTNERMFEDENNIVLISVSTFDQNITEDYIKDVGEKTTINNVTGYLGDLGFLAIFSSIEDGKLVVITASDKNIIEEVLS